MTASMTGTAIWLRIACAALLLSLGFAHKPLYAQPSSDPASSYYVLPDGSFADLCIDGVDRGKPGKHWLGSGCEACRLASGFLLPPPADSAAVSSIVHSVAFHSPPDFFNRTIERPGSPVRGPPSIIA
jgi:hypothetical protein